MKIFKQILQQIRWWEVLYLTAYFVVVLSVGIVFKSGALIILNAIFAVLSVFFVAKGIALGNALGIVNMFLYCANSFYSHFYGEIVCNAIITFPSYVLSLYTWIKSQRKDSQVLSVNKILGLLEWILTFVATFALSFGIYFLLRAFNTANLLVSTISTTLGMLAGYLLIRRCEFSFVFYLIGNFICIVLWASSLGEGNLVNLPIVFAYFAFLGLNSFGFFNWIKLKKSQNANVDEQILKICKTDLKI